VEGGERILRLGAAGVGRDAQQFGGARDILADLLAFELAQPRPAKRAIASAKIACLSPRSAASENQASAFFSSFATP